MYQAILYILTSLGYESINKLKLFTCFLFFIFFFKLYLQQLFKYSSTHFKKYFMFNDLNWKQNIVKCMKFILSKSST